MENKRQKLTSTIFKVAEQKKKFQVSDVTDCFPEKVSRQYIWEVLRELTSEEKLIKEGGGAYTRYALPEHSDYLSNHYSKRVVNKNLKEHEVFDEIQRNTPVLNSLKENVESIFTYAFLEMLNNAIEHSETNKIDINIHKDKNLKFEIRDYGIGVFRNIQQKKGLNDELEAIQDLLKGKLTTEPRAHSGEGIFFTSKVSDIFVLESFNYRLRIDNDIPDYFVEEKHTNMKGTLVQFILHPSTTKHLDDVFRQYQTNPDDYSFDKTEVHIKLYTIGGVYISRSQARRVLEGLENFKTVIMDFDQVPTIGQAFADEVFRVFRQKFPRVEIKPVNMNETVKFMVDRVEDPQPPLISEE